MTKSFQKSNGIVAVYDILNCGPRKRYAINGKIVSNSGHDGYNPQNLPNGSVSRTAIEAPPGHVLVVADSSQIELRMNAWLSKEYYVFEVLNSGMCIYITAAAAHYGVPYEYFTKASPERKFGKALTLGCGYGMGADKFQMYCASGPLGLDPMIISKEESERAINTYRTKNKNIVKNWKEHDKYLSIMLRQRLTKSAGEIITPYEAGPLRIGPNIITLPNGLNLQYIGLNYDGEQWTYGNDVKIYGAKLSENTVQALARVIISDQLLMMEAQGIRTVSSTHDEIIAVAKEDEAEQTFKGMIEIMSTVPEWAKIPGYPTLTLAAEGGYARNYSK